jgi:hypothetical protein
VGHFSYVIRKRIKVRGAREERERERARARRKNTKRPKVTFLTLTLRPPAFLSLTKQKNLQISPEKAIFMFVKNVLPPTGTRGGREEKKAGEKRVEGNLCSSS